MIVEDNGNIADASGNIDHSGVNKCGDERRPCRG